MIVKYYKTNTSAASDALESYIEEKKTYVSEFEAFAEKFHAKPVFTYDAKGMHFYGFKLEEFDSREDRDLWRLPDAKCGGASKIRRSVRGKANAERLAALKEMYESLVPTIDNPSRDSFYAALGTSWGDVVFGGLKWFMCNQVVYLATRLELTNGVTEIIASEFYEAERRGEK